MAWLRTICLAKFFIPCLYLFTQLLLLFLYFLTQTLDIELLDIECSKTYSRKYVDRHKEVEGVGYGIGCAFVYQFLDFPVYGYARSTQ